MVNAIDFAVPAGVVYGFLGPNGAGKTTTIRMLLGLIRPDAGSFRIHGEPFTPKLLGQIGSLVETPSLYPHLSGIENLEVTRRMLGVRKSNIDRVLEIVRLTKDGRRLVREYSLGMRQRLGLALALLHSPTLLILDEPTNGLDPAGIHEMRDLLVRMPTEYGVTVFLSSHLLGEVEQIAGWVCIVQEGRVLFHGPLDELRLRQQTRIRVGVRSGRAEAALRIVQAAGHEVTMEGPDRLSVLGSGEPAEINGLLWREGIEVCHLSMDGDSLERVFLTMTGGSGAAIQ